MVMIKTMRKRGREKEKEQANLIRAVINSLENCKEKLFYIDGISIVIWVYSNTLNQGSSKEKDDHYKHHHTSSTPTSSNLPLMNGTNFQELCQLEAFQASCPYGHAILMVSARYGRMRLDGRCVKRSWNNIGCFVDVTALMDPWCSGQRSCQVGVGELNHLLPCPEDLTLYLEVSHVCVRVEPVVSQPCKPSTPIIINIGEQDDHDKTKQHQATVTAATKQQQKATPSATNAIESLYLSSTISLETAQGTNHCPWRLKVNKGQIIRITLLNFARSFLYPEQQTSQLASSTSQHQHRQRRELQTANVNEVGDEDDVKNINNIRDKIISKSIFYNDTLEHQTMHNSTSQQHEQQQQIQIKFKNKLTTSKQQQQLTLIHPQQQQQRPLLLPQQLTQQSKHPQQHQNSKRSLLDSKQLNQPPATTSADSSISSSSNNNNNIQLIPASKLCYQFAIIKEGNMGGSKYLTLCEDGPREAIVYTSATDVIDLEIITSPLQKIRYFLRVEGPCLCSLRGFCDFDVEIEIVVYVVGRCLSYY
ncbi:hypothetical protein HELRODRAFT_159365 [Helobdella robusta]|uniref:SUEL-type lectin domain-containing protein n=1 Tax=Helobdella robusta TaxID=6412 RepID=T1ENY0_HELRO|nr:hypothetical protein HELRODRAFT_159365 [Helobdella robusta]ESO12780.1 hypothetical protein HELRODRAFT_159365 [Helobdella robusta]